MSPINVKSPSAIINGRPAMLQCRLAERQLLIRKANFDTAHLLHKEWQAYLILPLYSDIKRLHASQH